MVNLPNLQLNGNNPQMNIQQINNYLTILVRELNYLITEENPYQTEAFVNKVEELSNQVKKANNDYIIEQSNSGIWTMRKWESGVCELFGTKTITSTIDREWGNHFLSHSTGTENYPITFLERPKETVTAHVSGASVILVNAGSENGINTTTRSASYDVARPLAITNDKEIIFDFYVVGRYR